jgi:hypothetical protein
VRFVLRSGFLALVLALGSCRVSSDVSRELGARCDGHDECNERCLSSAEFPGGFCSLACDSDDDCPGDAACVDIDQGVCLYACADSSECEFLGAGWQCEQESAHPEGEVMVCIGGD